MKTSTPTQLRICPTPKATRPDDKMRPGITAVAALLVCAGPTFAQGWTLTGAPETNGWRSLAASADASKLVAIVSDVGWIYSSTNSGTNWSATGARLGLWYELASSADGTRLLAVGSDYRYGTNFPATFATDPWVYTSTNSGANWARAGVTPRVNGAWTAAASSADGRKLVVGATSGDIYTSTNAGGNWTLRSTPNKQWNSIASSADGTRLVAVAVNGGIHTSADSGVTWTPTSAPTDLWWWDVASSADGGKLVAVALYSAPPTPGSIYVSTNAGMDWMLTSAPTNKWRSVASSADATTLAAVVNFTSSAVPRGVIGISRDSGATWATTNPPSPNPNWHCVTVSADGNKIFAAVNIGGIHVSQSPATPRLEMNVAGGVATLSWIIPSMEFRLQESPDWSAINWTDVLAQLTSTNYRQQVILAPPSGNRFYRLQSY